MSKKYLFFAGIVCFIISLFAVGSVWFSTIRAGENVRGRYVFKNTRDNIQFLRHVKMITPVTGEINIYSKDGVWYFQEAANYFVNPEQLADFYYMINNPIFVTVTKGNKADYEKNSLLTVDEAKNLQQGTIVETYDEDEKLLDKVIISSDENNSENRYARIEKYPYIYTISSVRGFSGEAGAWVPFPLLEIPLSVIKKITLGKTSLSMEALKLYLPRSSSLQKLISVLTYISYDGIAYKKDFEQDFLGIEPHNIEIETKVGLIYWFDVYKTADGYWLTVKLKSTKIPRKEVVPFVAENQKYFADWVFNLSEEQGKTLYDMQVKDLFDSFKNTLFSNF